MAGDPDSYRDVEPRLVSSAGEFIEPCQTTAGDPDSYRDVEPRLVSSAGEFIEPCRTTVGDPDSYIEIKTMLINTLKSIYKHICLHNFDYICI